MIKDLIPIKYVLRVRTLGFKGCPTFYRVIKYFRKKWGYTSWIEESASGEFIYKIHGNKVYHRPINIPDKYPYCKTYQEAEVKLIKELILIVEEREK
jgi:hypothetical protein